MIWIILILTVLVASYFVWSSGKEERLYKKLLSTQKKSLESFKKLRMRDEIIKTVQNHIDEIENDHELYLRLLERLKYKKELKNMKDDYLNLLHYRDEVDTIMGIDPSSMQEQLREYHLKIDEIRKRFYSYGLEKTEP